MREQGKAGQRGFTAVEVLIGMVLAALVMAAFMQILSYVAITTGEQADKSMAARQAQSASLWIRNDVVQAQHITFGNTTGRGFPLVLWWDDPDPSRGNSTVTYGVGNMTDELGRDLWRLTRTQKVKDVDRGTIVIAECLDPASTGCGPKVSVSGNRTLVLDVTAVVDRSEQSSSYEVQPRVNEVTWKWGP